MKIIKTLLLFFSLLCIGNVFAEEKSPIPEESNKFGFKIYESIEREREGQNLSYAPFSVYQIMGMLYMCTKGYGYEAAELADKLNFSRNKNKTFKQFSDAIKISTANDPGITTSNSVWVNDKFSLKKDFETRIKNFFHASVYAGDFSTPAATKQKINGWVSEKTRNMIRSVDISIEPLTGIVLLNASVFIKEWGAPFEKAETKPRDFFKSDGTKVSTPFMNNEKMSSKAVYDDVTETIALQLSYKGRGHSMIIIMPAPGKNVENVNFDTFTKFVNALSETQFNSRMVSMPRFTVSSDTIPLMEKLKAAGINKVLGENVDFSEISDALLEAYVSDIATMSRVEVDEKGTKAAAVTKASFQALGIIEKKTPVIIDRPFKFFIIENKTNLILFMGTVNDPTKN